VTMRASGAHRHPGADRDPIAFRHLKKIGPRPSPGRPASQ
jgi:hypothetical protein